MSFDRYYDLFLQNRMRGDHYLIFRTGNERPVVGVPLADSVVDHNDPRFLVSLNDKPLTTIRFAEVHRAERLLHCQVRTLAPHTTGAGDFYLYVPEGNCNTVLEGSAIRLVGVVLPPTQFLPDAPEGTYKFVTVEGRDHRIAALELGQGGTLALTVEPEDSSD